ncbi:MAG: hypothetical protein ACE5I1_15625, partial [bacterium]
MPKSASYRYKSISMMAIFLFLSVFVQPKMIIAHGDHTKYSRMIIDPLITHHSILEDEQRINLFFFSNQRFGANSSNGVGMSMELAYAFSDFFGVEAFVPFASFSSSGFDERGIGDIEIQPLKLSFYRNFNFVVTGVMAFTLPTGSESRGLGGGQTLIEPHLFMDAAVGNWGIQANVVYGAAISGEPETELEYNLSVSRSFWGQKFGWTGLVELNGGTVLSGEESGESVLYVTPGAKLAIQGWHIGAGVQIP